MARSRDAVGGGRFHSKQPDIGRRATRSVLDNVGSVRFQKTGAIRTVYFGILITHTILAAAVPPLALTTLNRALHKRFDKHRRIARWALPIWLYVSITGVVVYVMLYLL